MTKRGSFKRAVRRQARATGKSYTETLSSLRNDEIASRIFAGEEWRGRAKLPEHLESTYGIAVTSMTQLSLHGGGVFRIDHEGPPWVVRVFPQASRSIERLAGDAEILRFLETHDLPAERCAHPEPISTFDGQSVLVTTFIPGPHPHVDTTHAFALADMLGRLHALPAGRGGAARPGGSWGHDPAHRGRPREDLIVAMSFLDAIERDVPSQDRARFDAIRDDVAKADACDDLPEALTRAGMSQRNVVVAPDGSLVAVDWKGAGRGPRLVAFASLLGEASSEKDGAIVDAIVSGYGRHVRLTSDELARLPAAMRISPLYFACWSYWRAVTSRSLPDGTHWWPDHSVTDRIAARAIDGLRQS